jgi:hypothetical protein
MHTAARGALCRHSRLGLRPRPRRCGRVVGMTVLALLGAPCNRGTRATAHPLRSRASAAAPARATCAAPAAAQAACRGGRQPSSRRCCASEQLRQGKKRRGEEGAAIDETNPRPNVPSLPASCCNLSESISCAAPPLRLATSGACGCSSVAVPCEARAAYASRAVWSRRKLTQRRVTSTCVQRAGCSPHTRPRRGCRQGVTFPMADKKAFAIKPKKSPFQARSWPNSVPCGAGVACTRPLRAHTRERVGALARRSCTRRRRKRRRRCAAASGARAHT